MRLPFPAQNDGADAGIAPACACISECFCQGSDQRVAWRVARTAEADAALALFGRFCVDSERLRDRVRHRSAADRQTRDIRNRFAEDRQAGRFVPHIDDGIGIGVRAAQRECRVVYRERAESRAFRYADCRRQRRTPYHADGPALTCIRADERYCRIGDRIVDETRHFKARGAHSFPRRHRRKLGRAKQRIGRR